jgi:glycosyltransferase involved in cell wall biosynthesis
MHGGLSVRAAKIREADGGRLTGGARGGITRADGRDELPLVSIVTVVLNGEDHLESAISSVLGQDYPNIEYIVIDGGSTDATPQIISKWRDRITVYVSEPDRGMYDGMNKGIRMASGAIVGLLNADDFYASERVVSEVVSEFQLRGVDSVFADLVIVDPNDSNKVLRYYDSSYFRPDRFAYGWMPAHPTFFVKRECYQMFGFFKTDYQIAADYELLVRFLARQNITYSYLDKVTVRMRKGGVSTRGWRSNWILNREIIRACRENGIGTNMLKVLSKYPRKFLQGLRRFES